MAKEKMPLVPQPVVRAVFKRVSDESSFSNPEFTLELCPGQCLWLSGPSGVGKTQSVLHLLGIQDPAVGTQVDIKWDSSIPRKEQSGMLFQNGVLVDSLSVSENIALALQAAGHESGATDIKKYLELVKLDAADMHKMPGQLSGGMLRRAALAQLLSQRKRLIVLDEPFTGLDLETAHGIIQELRAVMKEEHTSFILISHQVDLAALLEPVKTVVLRPSAVRGPGTISPPCTNGLSFFNRTMGKILDYFFLSLPLIVLCFFALGAAMGMLFGDALSRTEVTHQILAVMDDEAKSWPQMMRMFLSVAKEKVTELSNKYMPMLKAIIYSSGMAHVVTIEIGPLLTGLLLAGRIGGTYAGEVGTMQAGNQNRLLRTLGVSPLRWSLLPTIVAALIAAPLLTIVGAYTAIYTAGYIFEYYALGTQDYYWDRIHGVVFHPSDHWQNYPPYVLLYRSTTFMVLIIAIAELCARTNPRLQPRHVPFVITSAVVLSGLAILFADWVFSMVLIRYGLASDGFEVLDEEKQWSEL